MAQTKQPTESPAKGEAKEASPMDRFRKLTKDLSGVDPEHVREAERRAKETKSKPS